MTSIQHKTWVLVSNSNVCRIYNYQQTPHQLTLLREINHPENRLRDIELTSDKPGRYNTGGTARGAYTQQSDPKEIKIDNFSRQIAKELEHDRNINAFEKLIVIAPPHMSGLLFQHFSKHLKELITHKLEKDVPYCNEQDLLELLHKHEVEMKNLL